MQARGVVNGDAGAESHIILHSHYSRDNFVDKLSNIYLTVAPP